MAKIFIIMGKSSSGKDTVFKRLAENESLGLKLITMYTTRPMRENEVNGQEYFFSTEEMVKEYEAQNSIIELRAYDTIHGVWKYFTLNDGQFQMDSKDAYLVIGTLEAYEAYVAYFGAENVVPIYIEVDSGVRLHRALEREDREAAPKYAELCRRYLADEEDFSEEKLERAGIGKRYINQDLEQCISDIYRDMKALIL